MEWVNSNDIERWADEIRFRDLLPEIVSKLIRVSTNAEVVNIPYGNNVKLPGFDGEVIVEKGNEFVPDGKSLWEMGTTKNAKGKADGDYADRKPSKEASFVFVTPRLWTKNTEWVKEKNEIGEWKNVKVINSVVLEDWIKQCPSVGKWLAVKMGKFSKDGMESADNFWEKWSVKGSISLVPETVLARRDEEAQRLIDSYSKNEDIGVQSRSKEESIAFIIASFLVNDQYRNDFKAKAIIVEDAQTFKALSENKNSLILIPTFGDRGLLNHALRNGHKVLVPLESDNINYTNIIKLPLLDLYGFEKALINSGFSNDEAEYWAMESNAEITIFRRLAGFNKDKPKWCDDEYINYIIPLVLLGGIYLDKEGDCKILKEYFNFEKEDYIRGLKKLQKINNCPFEKLGNSYVLLSHYDTLLQTVNEISQFEFEKIATIAPLVLQHLDEGRYEEGINFLAEIGSIKNQYYSDIIKRGVCNTLELISFFSRKLSFDLPNVNQFIEQIISNVLKNNHLMFWKSITVNLPKLALANPEIVLLAIENQIENNKDTFFVLFKQSDSIWNNNIYFHRIIEALKDLAWLPNYLLRVSILLAKIDHEVGSYNSTALDALIDIYRVWLPKTKASFEQRIDCIKSMVRLFPEWGASLCLKFVYTPNKLNFTTIERKPRLVHEYSEGNKQEIITKKTVCKFNIELINIIKDTLPSPENLAELLNMSFSMCSCNRNEVLKNVRLQLLENRKTHFLFWQILQKEIYRHRAYSDAPWTFNEDLLMQYEEFLELTSITELDMLIYHFSDYPFLIEDLKYEACSDELENAIFDRRVILLKEFYDNNGLVNTLNLMLDLKEYYLVGNCLAAIELNVEALEKLLTYWSKNEKIDVIIKRFVSSKSFSDNEFSITLLDVLNRIYTDNEVGGEILSYCKPDKQLWDIIDGEIEKSYWLNVNLKFVTLNSDEYLFALCKMLNFKAHFSFLNSINSKCDDIPAEMLIEGLRGYALNYDKETPLNSYDIEKIFKHLYQVEGLDEIKMIELEFLYCDLINNYGNNLQTKYLFNKLKKDPAFYFELISYVYKKDDEVEFFNSKNENLSSNQIANRARISDNVLYNFSILPGTNKKGKIDYEFLKTWIEKVVELAKFHGRLTGTFVTLGKLLAHFPNSHNEIIPPKEICEIIEFYSNDVLDRNFNCKIYNGFSGSITKAGGKARQRADEHRAKNFKSISNQLSTTYPRVSKIYENLCASVNDTAEWHKQLELDRRLVY